MPALSTTVLDESIAYLKSFGSFDLDGAQAAHLRADFKEALGVFLATNYPQGVEKGTLMCSIHDAFPSHHSCVACNLQENARSIERYLLQFEGFDDVNHHYTPYLLLLYLLVERIHTYFDLVALPPSYRARHFHVFQEVKCWANFLKHPKSFMLVLHPVWHYKGLPAGAHAVASQGAPTLINSAFVKQYYSGDKNNRKLYELLARKDEVTVEYPHPVDLTTRFVKALQKFVDVIAENEMVREVLESETMVKQHFSTEETDEDQVPT